MKPLPTSPMKIFAGGQFQTRKPATQAAKTSGNVHWGVPVASHQHSAPPADTVIASMLAMPSMPSMKL